MEMFKLCPQAQHISVWYHPFVHFPQFQSVSANLRTLSFTTEVHLDRISSQACSFCFENVMNRLDALLRQTSSTDSHRRWINISVEMKVYLKPFPKFKTAQHVWQKSIIPIPNINNWINIIYLMLHHTQRIFPYA